MADSLAYEAKWFAAFLPSLYSEFKLCRGRLCLSPFKFWSDVWQSSTANDVIASFMMKFDIKMKLRVCWVWFSFYVMHGWLIVSPFFTTIGCVAVFVFVDSVHNNLTSYWLIAVIDVVRSNLMVLCCSYDKHIYITVSSWFVQLFVFTFLLLCTFTTMVLI